MNAKEYALFFESINKKTSINEYKKYLCKDILFEDPFHKVKGIDEVFKIFQKMFLNLENPYFKINETLQENDVAYINWTFYFKFKFSKKQNSFVGVSRIEIKNKKIISHTDYWDSAYNIYEKIPLLSFIIQYIKKRIRK